jgi:Na+-transporting methylmalonyl-CoA/oxaloacetate decarboxylase gamma subunit
VPQSTSETTLPTAINATTTTASPVENKISTDNSKGSNDNGAIVGLAIGFVFLFLIVLVLLIFNWRLQKEVRTFFLTQNQNEMTEPLPHHQLEKENYHMPTYVPSDSQGGEQDNSIVEDDYALLDLQNTTL